jgi:hypothetical protein
MLANRLMFQWIPSTTIFASEKKKGERGAEVRKSRPYSTCLRTHLGGELCLPEVKTLGLIGVNYDKCEDEIF